MLVILEKRFYLAWLNGRLKNHIIYAFEIVWLNKLMFMHTAITTIQVSEHYEE